MELTQMKCAPLSGDVEPLTGDALQPYMQQFNVPWEVRDEKRIFKEFKFDDFLQTMDFVNKVADLSEAEAHHPDLHVGYGRCGIELWTHTVGGLSENDFILAAKVDQLAE